MFFFFSFHEKAWVFILANCVRKVCRVQCIIINQSKFQNNSLGKIRRGLHYTLKDTYESIQVANKQLSKKYYKNNLAYQLGFWREKE